MTADTKERVPNDKLRAEVLRIVDRYQLMSWEDLAHRVGMVNSTGLKRALGIMGLRDSRFPGNQHYYNKTVKLDLAILICREAGIDFVDVDL